MDRMDRYLMQIPYPPPDDDFHAEPDFHRRIVEHVWRRRRRMRRMRVGASAFLWLVGLWLVVPSLFGWMTSVAVPESGLPWLYSLLDVLLQDFQVRLTISIQNVISYHSELAGSMGATAVLGFVIIAAASLLVIDQVMPKVEA